MQSIFTVLHNGEGRFESVTFLFVLRKQRKTDVRLGQRFTFYKSAKADWRPGRNATVKERARVIVSLRLQLYQIKAKAIVAVAFCKARLDVLAGLFDGSNAAVADELNERRLIQQVENEFGIVADYLAKNEPFGFEDFH